jgi:hypothetical protein
MTNTTTDTVTLDPTTGLPALPEGHYWTVKPCYLTIVNTPTDFPDDEPWVRVGWFRGTTLSPEEIQEVLSPLGYVNDNILKLETKVDFFSHNYVELYVRTLYPETIFSWNFDTEVTVKNINKRAAKVYRKWQERKANEKLYGKYPPKTLALPAVP